MNGQSTETSLLGAVVLIVVFVAVAIGLMAGLRERRRFRILIATAAAGLAFQLGHFAEHVAQTGYWTTHRDAPPWMTPWADALVNSFGRMAPDTPSFGMEALHLVGNAIFLAGAVAALVVFRRHGPAGTDRPARAGVVVQGVHVLEHVALTVTVVAGGTARGLSTLFGTLDPGPGLWTYRVWWHVTINAVGTVFIAVAVLRARRSAGSPITYRRALAGHAPT